MRTLIPSIACALLAACGLEPPMSPPLDVPGVYTVTGVVRDQVGRPVADARVELTRGNAGERVRAATTSRDGSYIFEWVAGGVQLRVIKPGYDIVERTAVVSANVGLDIELPLIGGGGRYVLSGVVRDQHGRPVPDAHLEITHGLAGEIPQRTTTDRNGLYTFEWVEGEVQLRVTKLGYGLVQRSVVLNAHVGLNIELPLHPTVVSDTLVLGGTIRSKTELPPCDPVHWDAHAPCRRFYFLSPSNGALSIAIRFGVASLDAGILRPGSNDFLDYDDAEADFVALSASVEAGRLYEIRVNSYYAEEMFELEANLTPF